MHVLYAKILFSCGSGNKYPVGIHSLKDSHAVKNGIGRWTRDDVSRTGKCRVIVLRN